MNIHPPHDDKKWPPAESQSLCSKTPSWTQDPCRDFKGQPHACALEEGHLGDHRCSCGHEWAEGPRVDCIATRRDHI